MTDQQPAGDHRLIDDLPVVICVPARNEEQVLPALLDALAALDRIRPPLTACVYLDACTDGSEAMVRRTCDHMPFALTVATAAFADDQATARPINVAPDASRARMTPSCPSPHEHTFRSGNGR